MAEVNVREVALSTLLEMEREKEYSHVMVQSVLEKYDYFDTRDKAFLKRLLEGTIERKITLDAVINQVSKTPVQKMKPLIRSLMRMSAYQILYMDKVGPAAACNEAVKLAMAHKFTQLKGFVNGVLRTISREKESLLDFTGERYKSFSDIQRASITYSMPEQILKIWQQDYGKAEMLRMAEASLQVRPVYIRIREDITKAEKEQGGRIKDLSVEITFDTAKAGNWKNLHLEMDGQAVNLLVKKNVKELKVNGGNVNLTFDSKALKELKKEMNTAVVIKMKQADK